MTANQSVRNPIGTCLLAMRVLGNHFLFEVQAVAIVTTVISPFGLPLTVHVMMIDAVLPPIE